MKPEYLNARNAARFQDEEVARLYCLRPPYPGELFTTLAALIQDEPRNVLDVGTGRGEIARFLTPYANRVDAVDVSEAMLSAGRNDPGGDAPNLHWILGRVEEVELDPPFALITGGSSLHWVEWEVAFARFETLLTPNGVVAIVQLQIQDTPWHNAWKSLIDRYLGYSNRIHLVNTLIERGLFHQTGEYHTEPIPFTQSVDEYVDAQHSYSSLARQAFEQNEADAFDHELRAVVTPYATDLMLTLQVSGHVVWGKPHAMPTL